MLYYTLILARHSHAVACHHTWSHVTLILLLAYEALAEAALALTRLEMEGEKVITLTRARYATSPNVHRRFSLFVFAIRYAFAATPYAADGYCHTVATFMSICSYTVLYTRRVVIIALLPPDALLPP